MDDLAQMLGIDTTTPEFRAAYADAEARSARQVDRRCPFGNCATFIDPLDGKITGGFGPVGCGCDTLPGWRSPYYDGLPKPGWSAKPVGRHGGRVAASRRKAREHARWLAAMEARIAAI